MKIRFELPPGTGVKVDTDSCGRVTAVTVEPMFLSPRGLTLVASGAVLSGAGEGIETFALLVSGDNGKVVKRGRSSSVRPLVDMTEEERAILKRKRTS